jgi:hypothetical protein
MTSAPKSSVSTTQNVTVTNLALTKNDGRVTRIRQDADGRRVRNSVDTAELDINSLFRSRRISSDLSEEGGTHLRHMLA